MFGVCFFPTRKADALNQWSYVLSHWRPNYVFLLTSSENPAYMHKHVRDATHIVTADALPDLPMVLLAPQDGRFYQGDQNLATFTHPKECVYMFGPDHHHLSEDEMGNRVPDHLVYIETDSNDEMYASIAAAVTLFDRKVKNG